MAKLAADSPIRFRGKLSNIVAAEWNGMIVIRAAPHWKKKYKPTPKQYANQQRFKYANTFVGIFRDLLDMTVQKEPGQTRASIAMRGLLNEALVGDWPKTQLDYSRLQLARGTLPPADSPVAKAGETGRIEFEWEYDFKKYPKDKDYGQHHVMLIAYSKTSHKPAYDVHAGFRNNRKGTLQCSFKKGEEVHTWISFRTGDFGFKANSVYTGLVKMK